MVRDWREEDAEALQRIADDRRIWLNLRDAFPHPYRLEDGRAFIAAARAQSPPTVFAIVAGVEIAGGIGYIPRMDVERISAEVGYWVGARFWGRGIATTALRLMARHAFAAHPQLERLFAVPYATNAASARVLEKAGFVREGTMRRSAIKDGRVLDQWMYARLRDQQGSL